MNEDTVPPQESHCLKGLASAWVMVESERRQQEGPQWLPHLFLELQR